MPASAAFRRSALGVEDLGHLPDARPFGLEGSYLVDHPSLFWVWLKAPALSPPSVCRCAAGVSPSVALSAAAVTESLPDHAGFQLGYGAGDLAHEGPHRVVGVVGLNLAGIDGEHPAAVSPHERKSRFLHSEAPRKAIEARDDERLGGPALDGSECACEAVAVEGVGGTGDGFVGADLHDAVPVLAGPGLDGGLLDVEAPGLGADLAVGADSEVRDEAEAGAAGDTSPYTFPLGNVTVQVMGLAFTTVEYGAALGTGQIGRMFMRAKRELFQGLARSAVVLSVLALVTLAACGGDDDDAASPSDTAQSTTTTSSSSTTTEAAAEPDTMTAPCEAVAESSLNRIIASLEGDPTPTVAASQTAMFTVSGDDGRVIALQLSGPGVGDDPAIFMVGPSGSFYSANIPAKAFSDFDPIDLGSEWNEPIDYVIGCLDAV